MTALEILVAAKVLIADPKKHTTEVFARDGQGHRVPPLSTDAVCWCATGAVAKVGAKPEYGTDECRVYDSQQSHGVAINILNQAAESVTHYKHTSIESVNDKCSHAVIMQCFDKAIEIARDAE